MARRRRKPEEDWAPPPRLGEVMAEGAQRIARRSAPGKGKRSEENVLEALLLLLSDRVSQELKSVGATPLRLVSGTLWLQVPSPVWAQQLQLQSPQLVARLNELLDRQFVTDLRFTVASIRPDRRPKRREKVEPAPQDVEETKLTQGDQRALERVAKGIEDGALRERFRAAAESYLRATRWKLQHGWGRCKGCGAAAPPGQAHCPVCAAT